MNDTLPTNEVIENAYKPVSEVLTRLPDGAEKLEAQRLLVESERCAHVSHEKIPAEAPV